MRQLCVLFVLILTANFQSAQAQTNRQIALAALGGDSFLISQYQTQTGTRIANNALQRVELPGAGLNGAIALEAERQIQRECRSCKVVLLGGNPKISTLQAAVVSGKASVDQLVIPYLDAAKQSGATHLVLITRHRGEVAPQFVSGKMGYGKVDGLGFFIDNSMGVMQVDTGVRAQGYMGLFSYMRFLLIDVVNERILLDKTTTSNRVFANYEGKGDSGKAWDALTSEEKVAALENMARDDIEQTLPSLFQAARLSD